MEWTNIPLFIEFFPKGKVIHIIRDPRDVLVSYKKMTIETGKKYLDSIFANMHSFDFALQYSSELPKERYLVLKYEDFIRDKKSTIQFMCEYLEIEFDNQMLNVEKYKDAVGQPFVLKDHSSFPNSEGPPLDRWKDHIDLFELELIEALLAKQMRSFNYQLSENFIKSNLFSLFSLLDEDELIKERLINYLISNHGVESFPSDPTDSNNWSGDLLVRGKGAAALYGKREKKYS